MSIAHNFYRATRHEGHQKETLAAVTIIIFIHPCHMGFHMGVVVSPLPSRGGLLAFCCFSVCLQVLLVLLIPAPWCFLFLGVFGVPLFFRGLCASGLACGVPGVPPLWWFVGVPFRWLYLYILYSILTFGVYIYYICHSKKIWDVNMRSLV